MYACRRQDSALASVRYREVALPPRLCDLNGEVLRVGLSEDLAERRARRSNATLKAEKPAANQGGTSSGRNRPPGPGVSG
jgi:hypothetical protein